MAAQVFSLPAGNILIELYHITMLYIRYIVMQCPDWRLKNMGIFSNLMSFGFF